MFLSHALAQQYTSLINCILPSSILYLLMCKFKKLTTVYVQFFPPQLLSYFCHRVYFCIFYKHNNLYFFALDNFLLVPLKLEKKKFSVYFHFNHFQKFLILCISLNFCHTIFFLPKKIRFTFFNVCAANKFPHFFFA